MYQDPQTAWLDCTKRRLELTRISRAIYRWCLSGESSLAWWLMARSTEALFVHAEVEETLPLFKSQVLLNTVHRTTLALCTGREKRESARESPTCGNSPWKGRHHSSSTFARVLFQICICLIKFFFPMLRIEPRALCPAGEAHAPPWATPLSRTLLFLTHYLTVSSQGRA